MSRFGTNFQFIQMIKKSVITVMQTFSNLAGILAVMEILPKQNETKQFFQQLKLNIPYF